MKLLTTAIIVTAWVIAATVVGTTEGFAGLSPDSFAGRTLMKNSNDPTIKSSATATGYRASWLMYENARDGSSDNSNSNSAANNVWGVLAHTESWISETLASQDTGNGNPYSRKEVNYVCETHEDAPMIAANMFKRLREAREMGEHHGVTEEDHLVDQGDSYRPHTLRQTQVMVIPGNEALSDSFKVFDKFINAVNTARRNARDYVTDKHLEKLDQELAGEVSRDWSVSVNCAHLHPGFGKKSPEEIVKQLKEEEASGEVDVHAQEYAEKRLAARQSPYPTIVVEVRATPPPDWGEYAVPQAPLPSAEVPVDDEEEDTDEGAPGAGQNYNRKKLLNKQVTAADVQKLEALFGKAAVTEKNVPEEGKKPVSERKEKESSFYDAIGKSIEEVSFISHMRRAQEWIKDNDDKFSPLTNAFTESDTTEIDHGYEFIFTNMAMQKEQAKADNVHGSRRQYLVMPHFLSSSATSLEKFTKEVKNIVDTLPDLKERVKLSTFHPEHVLEERRSPMPIICLQWIEGGVP